VDALALARWQFAITTVYHFIFVPLTIGLAPLVAIMQTAWVRTGNERWLKLTKFFGKLFLINFAIGVVTGIVQEFQFGMNWSEYSRFVGDIFGAPLAMEALAAFFIESTFIGLWVFGWGRLSKKVHLTMIWLVAIAVNLSAFFIIAANSWMQHPVGAQLVTSADGTTRAEMTSIGKVLGNPTVWVAWPHTVTAAFLTAGTFVAGISAWWMVRLARTKQAGAAETARNVYRPGLNLGVIVMIIAGLAVIISGDQQAKLMVQQQPMKMAAAEAICDTTDGGAPFTIAAFGSGTDCAKITHVIQIPGLTSFLSHSDFNTPVQGVNDVQATMTSRYGDTTPSGQPANYAPDIMGAFWAFRIMIGLGIGSVALAIAALWLTRKGRISDSKALSRIGLIAIVTPFLGCSFGWIFTEIGRQPWLVNPNPTGIDEVRLMVERGVSTVVSPGLVLTSMVVFTLVYGALAVAWYRLMHRYTVEGVPAEVADESPEAQGPQSADTQLTFAY
jgi:cytochrome d ubiquinol oxidase subunit I